MDESKPLKWRVNDRCMAPYSEDQLEYEAEIKDILTDESGCSYALIEFIGYDQVETVWMDDLRPMTEPDEVNDPVKREHSVPSLDSQIQFVEAEKDHVEMDSGLEEGGEDLRTTSPSEVVKPPTVDELISLSDPQEKKCVPSLSPVTPEEPLKPANTPEEFIEKLISLNLMEDNKSLEGVRPHENYINDLIQVEKDVDTLNDQKLVSSSESESCMRDEEVSRINSENQELKQEVNALKVRLQDLGERKHELEMEGKNMREQMKSLTQNMDVLSKSMDERVATVKAQCQGLELQLNDLQSSQKECIENGATNHADEQEENVSKSKVYVPSFGSPLKREENHLLLIDQGPIHVGPYIMQPVLCYFPVLDKSEVSTTLLQGGGSSKGSDSLTSTPHKTSSSVVQLWKSKEGSQELIKLLEDDTTSLDRIIDIFDNIKSKILEICIHEWGHKVIISLLSVSPRSISQSIKSSLWTNGLPQCLKSQFGAYTLIHSLKGISANDQLLVKVEKALIDYGVLELMLHEEGYRIITAVIDGFKPAFLLKTISKNILKLAVDKKGCIVLSKALSLYEHSQILPFVTTITQNANFINANSPQAASIFGGILENHLASGMLVKDHCIDNLRPVLSSDIKISLRKLLDTSSVGSNWFCAP